MWKLNLKIKTKGAKILNAVTYEEMDVESVNLTIQTKVRGNRHSFEIKKIAIQKARIQVETQVV